MSWTPLRKRLEELLNRLLLEVRNLPKLFSPFHVNDFTDLPRLVAKLTQRADPVSTFLSDRFSSATRGLLANYQPSNPTPLQTALAIELNKVAGGPLVFDARRFSGVALRSETKNLQSKNPQGESARHLNRLLLEDAYPLELCSRRRTTLLSAAGRSHCLVPRKAGSVQVSDPEQPAGSSWTEDSHKIRAMEIQRFERIEFIERLVDSDLTDPLTQRQTVDRLKVLGMYDKLAPLFAVKTQPAPSKAGGKKQRNSP